MKLYYFTKARRAQNVNDFETWIEGGVAPTLNVFDNNGDTRATVLIFEATRVDDSRFYDKYCPTVASYWGTGGARVPYVYAIQNTVIGRNDDAGPQGKGFGENSSMFTIDTTSPHAIATSTTVRRLTPKECERLQGFPDDWTAEQSDSTRYKQIGNAVAVPVVDWIIKNLIEVTR